MLLHKTPDNLLHLLHKHPQLCLRGQVPPPAAQLGPRGIGQFSCHITTPSGGFHHADSTDALSTHPATASSSTLSPLLQPGVHGAAHEGALDFRVSWHVKTK